MIIVLDTSVAIKWFFEDESAHEKAISYLNHLANNSDNYIVPIIFHIEFTAVITRKSKWDKKFISNSLKTIFSLGINTAAIGEELATVAIKIACEYKLSFYDAIYLALAKSLSGKWLTADKNAAKKCPSKHVLLLGD